MTRFVPHLQRLSHLTIPLLLILATLIRVPSAQMMNLLWGIVIAVGVVAVLRVTSAYGMKPLAWLHRFPALLWLLWLSLVAGLLAMWIVVYQPAAGLPIEAGEWVYLAAAGYLSVALFSIGLDAETRSKMQLGWLGGVLTTLTTVVFIVFIIELGMRYIWIQSDNFQFSKSHQTWARLYWNPINALNYRDYAPPPSDDPRTNIIVVGDSLAAGYGVNDIDDTFPHRLSAMLGDDTTMNIVAEPGWGISTGMALLEQYPIEPDILVLSHYTNDIAEGPAGQLYGSMSAFPQIRLEPNQSQRWWVENTFFGNFMFYRVFLYTQHESATLYNDWIFDAYNIPEVWAAYEAEMQAVIDYAESRDMPLVVIVWANLLDIDGSRQYTDPVRDYFASRGISVVDMAAHLADVPANLLIANPFDAHPNSYSHRIAAEQLAETIRTLD